VVTKTSTNEQGCNLVNSHNVAFWSLFSVLFQLSQSIYSNNANIDPLPETLQAPISSSSSAAGASSMMSLPDGAVENLTSVYDSIVYIGQSV